MNKFYSFLITVTSIPFIFNSLSFICFFEYLFFFVRIDLQKLPLFSSNGLCGYREVKVAFSSASVWQRW